MEFSIILGIPRDAPPFSFSPSISYSNSPIVSFSVYKFTPKKMDSVLPLLFLFTKIEFVSSKYSYFRNKLLNAICE